jgi:hypothetical protein
VLSRSFPRKCVSGLAVPIVLAVLAAHTRAQTPSAGTLMNLAAELLKAASDAKQASDDLAAVKEVVEKIEAGKPPGVSGNPWAGLAESYRKATEGVVKAPLPAVDSSSYAFSAAELISCRSRAASLAKGEAFAKELAAASKRGTDSIARLDGWLDQVSKAEAALKYLIDVHTKLIKVPIYGSIFTWDWFELNTNVSQSLASLRSALSNQRRQLMAATPILQQRADNLTANIKQIGTLSCSMDAHWKGTASSGGTTLPMAILVARPTGNGGWTLQINLNDSGGTVPATVTNNDRSIVFSIPTKPPLTFTGQMSDDGMTLSGSFVTPAGTWALRRQP